MAGCNYKKVRKAVIPAAGLGTRFLPLTKSVPKEMFPLIDRPIIHYVVEEAILSGIEDILIITARGKRAIEDYFDASPELEMLLQKSNKKELLMVVKEVESLANIHYIRQKEPRGLGDAVLRAEKHIGDEPFAVLLGDNVIKCDVPCIKQLISVFEKYEAPVIAVEELPKEKISRYAAVKGKMIDSSLYLVEDILEKPPVERIESNLGTVGRYIFTPEIFDCIKETPPDIRNEVQLTDAIGILKDRREVYAFKFNGKRYDTGNKLGYIQAILDFALEIDEIRNELVEHLKRLVNV